MIVLNVRSLNDHTVSLWTTVQKNKKITEKIDNKSSAHFLIYIVNPNMKSTIKFLFYNHSFKRLAFDWSTHPAWRSGTCNTNNIHVFKCLAFDWLTHPAGRVLVCHTHNIHHSQYSTGSTPASIYPVGRRK